ncbi:MAG: hypothetical protein WBW93_02905 [Steroidobacteraceae bacterium]
MDVHGGHESAHPRPARAWSGVALFTLGAILSGNDRQSAVIAIPLYAIAMLQASQPRAPSPGLP